MSRRHRVVLAAIVMVTTTLSIGAASAVTVAPGVLGNFQQDGNQVIDDDPLTTSDDEQIDWATFAGSVDPAVDDTGDSGFQGSSKELKPSDWTCNTGGAEPSKGNLLRSYLNPRPAAGFIDLAWVRQNLTSSGDVEVDFELNQAAPPAGGCKISRTRGDILITYRFPGGTTAPDISAFKWAPHAVPTSQEDGVWIDLGLTTSDANGAVNTLALLDDVMTPDLDPIGAESFGEATVQLAALFESDEEVAPSCRSFGYLNIRSKSSRENDRAALQDRMPTQDIDLFSCGGIVLQKVNDHQPAQPMEGVEFGLFATEDAEEALVTCLTDEEGMCWFADVEPGTYWIREIGTIDGYEASSDALGPITVEALLTTDLTATPVVNIRQTGFVSVTKLLADSNQQLVTPPDPTALDGATFLIYLDGNDNDLYETGEEVKLWPTDTDDATCTIAEGAGGCTIGPIPTGEYRLTETVAPVGTLLTADDVDITVSPGTLEDALMVEMTNSLDDLDLTLVKDGPVAVYVGDTITYTFTVSTSGPRLHELGINELTSGRCEEDPVITPDLSSGLDDGFLDVGDEWVFSCSHLVTIADLNQLNGDDELVNTAESQGVDGFGRDVTSAPDDHAVLIVQPAITLSKTVNGSDTAAVAPGDALNFVLQVTNTGNVDLTITGLTDSLHNPLPPSCAALLGTVLAAGATTSCSYTDVADETETNVAVVNGLDLVLADPAHGVSWTDSATVTVDEVLDEVFTNSGELPRTGDNPDLLAQGLILAAALCLDRLRRRVRTTR